MSPVFYEGRDSVKAKFSTHERPPVERGSIGNDVWIGEGAFTQQVLRIGLEAVVGMGSVVPSDVQDYAIVGGVPARIIRRRIDWETVRRLLETRWWEFDDENLRRLARHFKDPQRFLSEAESK